MTMRFKEFRAALEEKTLTPAEKKKREEVAKAIERENPGMPMGMKMAIATKTAKRVAEQAYTGKGNHQPGWMLKADPELAKKLKEKQNKHQAMVKAMGNPAAGKSVKEEAELDEEIKKDDFVKDPQGKIHRVFDVKGNMLHTGEYRGKNTYGGTSMLHKTKATKVAKPADIAEEADMHYCAKHVYSDMYGEGVVVEGMHADPDEDGNIEWYAVEFNDGVKKVYTENLEIMIAEYHSNHKRKRKVMG